MRTPSPPTNGFTALPRRLLDAVLCADLSKRELLLWLLIARLTYGMRGQRWVALRPVDMAAIGIGSNHARQVLEQMLERQVLLQNGTRQEYRINAEMPIDLYATSFQRAERLQRLVARQIGNVPEKGTSPMGRKSMIGFPKRGNEIFPQREFHPSPEGNVSTVPVWEFSRSERQFVQKMEAVIDKGMTKINKGFYGIKEEA